MPSDGGAGTPPHDGRRGYAIALVTMLLLLVGMLAMTSYHLVEMFALLRSAERDSLDAEAGADAGMVRLAGDWMGTPPASETFYTDARTRVTLGARRLTRLSGQRSLYLLTATATHGDTLSAASTLRRYAMLEPVVRPVAALSLVSGRLTVARPSSYSGSDAATSGACSAVSETIAGALGVGGVSSTSGNPFSGSPNTRTASSRAEALSLLGVRWDILLGADAPVDFQDAWPTFTSLPVDSFPVVRYGGDLTLGSPVSGRGLLIVGGTLRPGYTFTWNGVVISGGLDPTLLSSLTIRGLLVTGLDGAAGDLFLPAGPDIRYDRCAVQKAIAPLARLKPLENATWIP